MKHPAPLSCEDEECQISHNNYGTIDGSHNSKHSKRSSVKVTLMGHQPCHQLEVSRRSSTNSQTTTESQLSRRALFYDEMSSMIKLAIPVTLTYILEMLPGIITIVLVGRAGLDSINATEEETSLQKLQIDAAALAVMFMNVVALSPGFGRLQSGQTILPCTLLYWC